MKKYCFLLATFFIIGFTSCQSVPSNKVLNTNLPYLGTWIAVKDDPDSIFEITINPTEITSRSYRISDLRFEKPNITGRKYSYNEVNGIFHTEMTFLFNAMNGTWNKPTTRHSEQMEWRINDGILNLHNLSFGPITKSYDLKRKTNNTMLVATLDTNFEKDWYSISKKGTPFLKSESIFSRSMTLQVVLLFLDFGIDGKDANIDFDFKIIDEIGNVIYQRINLNALKRKVDMKSIQIAKDIVSYTIPDDVIPGKYKMVADVRDHVRYEFYTVTTDFEVTP